MFRSSPFDHTIRFMIFLISPSKTQDFSLPNLTEPSSLPQFVQDADRLAVALKKKSAKKLSDLMDISPALAEQNYERFQSYALTSAAESPRHHKQALMAYTGDVYSGFDLESYSPSDFEFAQSHLRIVSGLYGLLRPLDLIQPYRLEMKTQLKNTRGKDLYKFWGKRITGALQEALSVSGSEVVVNLASNEYTKAIQLKSIGAEVITPTFKDFKNGEYKSLMLFLKQARGKMADYAIREKLNSPEGLQAFSGMGYQFNADLTQGADWVFTRGAV